MQHLRVVRWAKAGIVFVPGTDSYCGLAQEDLDYRRGAAREISYRNAEQVWLQEHVETDYDERATK